MFSTLITIMRGRSERAREGLEATHATLIIEQKIREAEAGHDRAKRSLASLILRERSEDKALAALKARKRDMEDRVRSALSAGKDALARDGADALADMENEAAARKEALERTRKSAARLRLLVEKSERRLVDLRQGLITARAMEAERRSAVEMRGGLGGTAALGEAEAVLRRTLASDDPIEAMDILDGIHAELSGDGLADRMAAEGIGQARRTRGEDILARFQAEIAPAATSAPQA